MKCFTLQAPLLFDTVILIVFPPSYLKDVNHIISYLESFDRISKLSGFFDLHSGVRADKKVTLWYFSSCPSPWPFLLQTWVLKISRPYGWAKLHNGLWEPRFCYSCLQKKISKAMFSETWSFLINPSVQGLPQQRSHNETSPSPHWICALLLWNIFPGQTIIRCCQKKTIHNNHTEDKQQPWRYALP